MSASEKLKALEAQIDRAEGITSLRPAGWILTDALPQIVAVVELEQEFMDECEQECLAQDTSWPPLAARDDLVARKYRALTALEEALP